MSAKPERAAVFEPEFREDLKYRVAVERKTALRILTLVEDTLRSPFDRLGKPEPVRYRLNGAWSRRITGEHRMVYRVYPDHIAFLAARYHYGD